MACSARAFIPSGLALLTSIAGLVGCTSAPPTAPGTRALVGVAKTAFYKYGPAQTFGPDFLLNQDSRVTILRRDWAFTRVMTEDGTTGYIASEDLKAAPPEPALPPASSTKPDRRSSGKPRRSNVPSTPDSPLFDMTDLPALPAETASPKPSPDFRF